MGRYQTRDGTCVPWIGKRILNHSGPAGRPWANILKKQMPEILIVEATLAWVSIEMSKYWTSLVCTLAVSQPRGVNMWWNTGAMWTSESEDHNEQFRVSVSIDSPTLFWYVLKPFLMAQMVKNLPTRRETGVRPLDWEDPLEKGMAGYLLQYSCWRIPWTEEPDEVAKSWTRLSEELHCT